MTPAERAALMGLARKWDERAFSVHTHPHYTIGASDATDKCADELRALLAEFEREDGDG